jgi:hypothetical protein
MTNRAALVAQLAALLADGRSAPLTDRLAVAARQLLQVDGLSLTLQAASRNRVTLAVTDQIAAELEQLQDVLSQGPCWSADQTGEPQRADLSEVDDERWPQFQAAARTAVGPRSVFALPMQPGPQVLGVISAHLANGTDLPTGLEDALFLADTIGAALLTDPQQHHPYGQAGSWTSRTQVHQATGMLIAQLRLPADDALAILRAHAYAHNTSLEDIADQVIARSLSFDPDAP